ncbi:uncharacterized protein LOC119384908 [Rhipicephalus sanguineus]|uniref:uncharacterized protein LOC119384908 n=1 Tax=Rhipicephalus sanguineus TaxID=34632 RepID=UPI0020C1E59A|nr:uncharacterized protein LOC119384908 [Rhipicephalus sanguineus]
MTGPVVDAAEMHSLLAHYNLSVEVFESAARDVVIEHLVRLAAHGDYVPALRVRHVGAPTSHSSNTSKSSGDECWLEPGSPSRLASLDAAILSGQVAALLSKALQLTISTNEVEQAAALRGNRSSDDGSEFERDAAATAELMDVRRLLSDSPLWVAALNASLPFIEAANFICRVAEPDTVSAELHLLEAAPLHSLRMYLLLCCTADLLRSELRKFDAGFWAAGACIDDLRRMHRVQTWNRLLWLVVQPWNKDLKVREQVYSVREQLLLFVSQSSAPFELKLNVTDALRNLSLAYARSREPDDSAVALDQQQSKQPDLERNESADRKWPYYAMLDELAMRKAASRTDGADAALPQLAFNYTENRLYLSLGALVPPSFDERYSKDSALQLTNNRLATERQRNRIRLVFQAACGSICSASSSRDPERRPLVRSEDSDGWRLDAHRTVCHAAVLNAPVFFRLFDCEPTSRMAQAGVCPLA